MNNKIQTVLPVQTDASPPTYHIHICVFVVVVVFSSSSRKTGRLLQLQHYTVVCQHY